MLSECTCNTWKVPSESVNNGLWIYYRNNNDNSLWMFLAALGYTRLALYIHERINNPTVAWGGWIF